ncbi:MAG: putative 2OG-Fe(II) oxygenase [Sphingomicrobium sp.]
MTFAAALAAIGERWDDLDALTDLAELALAEGEEERALPLVERALEKSPTPRLWQWKGLLERAIDEHQRALDSFAEAARLDPFDVSIVHGHARVAMEAGVDAQALYERALALAPQNGALIIGLAAARAAAGNGDAAAAELDAALERSPMWLYGHEQLAQVLATLGRADQATASLERALGRFPNAVPLWETLLNVQLRRGAYGSLKDIVERAEAARVRSPEFAIYRGIHAAEFDHETYPSALFDGAPASADEALGRWRIRHLLRLGAADAALPIIDRELKRDQTVEMWAYASAAWRLAGDPRSEWLEGDPRLVSVTDLSQSLPPLETVASKLRSLHLAKGEYLDQSVRGGTQTDGPLFSRIDPVIREIRQAIVAAVELHVAQLPPVDPGHPMLRHRRDRRTRFSGSWSVRLRSGGRHSNHLHPRGWISSALYIALPERQDGEPDDAGWLTLGEPDDLLGLDLPPVRKIEPKSAQLVLFPSWMWHGTRPFADGERLTVAFDVGPPT